MKAIIFHGTNCNPDDDWYKWLKQNLEKRNYNVELPHYPTINQDPIDEFLPIVLKNHIFEKDTVLIGHSAGVPLILSILERIDKKIAQIFLVAGFSRPLEGPYNKILQQEYDWAKITSNVKDVVIFNSANDPYGCDEGQGLELFRYLSGTLIIRNEGHFETKEFPLLEQMIGATL